MRPLSEYQPFLEFEKNYSWRANQNIRWMEDTQAYSQLIKSVNGSLLELLRDQIAIAGNSELEMYMDVLTTIDDGAKEPALIGRGVIEDRGSMLLIITVINGAICVRRSPYGSKTHELFDLADPGWCQNAADYINRWYKKTGRHIV